jgi:hypothetical protein|nr:MAG TPA: hypothetical protein [Caudoviricetes sp.]
MMTEKDKELIRRAKSYTYLDSIKVFDMAKEADTEEAKKELKLIGSTLYHEEEWHAGLL